MPAPQQILDLVERYKRNREEYESGKYNETQLRREFLDPLFKALGWDVTNEKGYSEAYKEVIHEDAIKIGAATKAPDYCFRIGGTRKFFLEAKKPSINIKDDLSPAFQLRRYAWSAKLPLSILSDFEELAVYDCRVKPYKTDKASTARILYFTFDQYAEKWDEIAAIFSQDAVLKGSFDKYAEAGKNKKGTTTVDEAFLEEIENWRKELAKNIASKNSKLSIQELNFSVQKIIDRIIFLRICEDRGIEPYGKLLGLVNGTKTYDRLTQAFQRADERYNSGLFHFQKEKDRPEQPDELTLKLKIDDKVFKDMISGLYYPESPYEFSALPADILGQVYEQFLGKVIRLTDGHQAKVEDKPEVKKAGGVFYTPTYIVEYIVKNTVGKLCEGKTPKQVAKLRVLDPACGSGSFLIGAYQYLLNWHLEWYLKDGPEKYQKELYQGSGGDWRLTTETRKKILLNNIYGVDIDSQAVEVAKLSLLLKVLEGESDQTLKRQLEIFHQRALPDLGSNIKCGNSLIGSEYFSGQLLPDLNVLRRVNPFDWQKEFSDVMVNGGFDLVIGNPPYIRIQAMKEWAPLEVEIYKENYRVAASGNYDIYVVFVEKGLSILNKNGKLGFILPNKFFVAQYGEVLRGLISGGRHLSHLVDFGDVQIFKGATTYTCLLFLEKNGFDKPLISKVFDVELWRNKDEAISEVFDSKKLGSNEWNFFIGNNSDVLKKLSGMKLTLKDISERIFQGLITGCDSVFLLEKVGNNRFYSEATKSEYEFETVLMHKLCKGSLNVKRYSVTNITKSILFPYEIVDGKMELIKSEKMKKEYPLIWSYLNENKKILESRERGKWKHGRWYALGRSQNLNEMEQRKLLTPSIANQSSFVLDPTGEYYFVGSGGGGGGGYGITLKSDFSGSYEYVLGLLNSKLLDDFLKSISSKFSGGYYAYNRQYIEQIPIQDPEFLDVELKPLCKEIENNVKEILRIKLRMQDVKEPNEQEQLKRQEEFLSNRIDSCVLKIYGI